MPPRFQDNGAISSRHKSASEMEAEEDRVTTSRDSQAHSSSTLRQIDLDEPKRTKNKQSMDYMLRSGLAGGLAGCAVNSLSQLVPLVGNSYRARRKLSLDPSIA